MTRILVTGGAGWLGGAVVRRLLARGDEVIAGDLRFGAADNTLAAEHANLSNRVLDLTDAGGLRAVLVETRPDAIVHCAAIVGVTQCADAPLASLRVNVEGMGNLLEAMLHAGIGRMIHVSTEETYGDFQSAVIDEDHPQRPLSIYGASKLAAEHLARTYARNHEMECIHVRTCWVYGPDLPRPRMPKTYIDAVLAGNPLVQSGGRDFAVDQVYIDDTVSGLILALDKRDHRFDAYNVATGVAPTLGEVAQIVNAAIPGGQVRVDPGPLWLEDRILSVAKGALDIRRAVRELGYEPRFSIERGIALTIEAARHSRNAH